MLINTGSTFRGPVSPVESLCGTKSEITMQPLIVNSIRLTNKLLLREAELHNTCNNEQPIVLIHTCMYVQLVRVRVRLCNQDTSKFDRLNIGALTSSCFRFLQLGNCFIPISPVRHHHSTVNNFPLTPSA